MAQPSPGNLRSPRKRALEIGTEPAGFAGIDYDSQGGHPVTPETPRREYAEQDPAVTDTGPAPIQGDPIGG
ncbi:MAG: hypothetical protein V3W28_01510 [Thermoplasmata archaeon]